MLSIQLYIEGQEVDLYDDESVTLTQSIQNVMDIQKVFTDFSKTFSVPASKNNNKIFKHFHNPHILGFDARYKVDAELHLNYKLFKKGKIKLEGATRKDNKAHTYKLTFFGNTVSIKDLIGEDKLDALKFINNYFTFVYTDANIKTFMEDGLDINVGEEVFTDAILFPLISHTKRFIYDSGHDANNVNTETLNNIAYIADSNYNLEISQLKPAIKVHAIIRAIEEQYGLEFSEDFFNTNNQVYNQLYLWLHNNTGAISNEEINEAFVDGYFMTRNEGQLEIKSGGFQLINSKKKRLSLAVKPGSNNPFNVVIYLDGKEYARYDNVVLNNANDTEWSSYNQLGGKMITGFSKGFVTVAIESATANTYDVRLHVYASPHKNWEAKKDTYFSGTASVGVDEQINVTRQMPDIKVIDFLTGIFKMFNLTSFRKDNGIVEVKSLDDFYGDSTTIWDITEHIDKTEQEVNTVLPYKQIDFSYKGTDSFLAKSFEQLTKRKWGSLEYNIDRKFDGKVYKVELPFEHFQYERLKNQNDDTLTDIQWGWSADIKQEAFVGKPLLFYPVLQEANYGIKDISGVISPKTKAYIPSNSISTTNSFNINFGSEYNEYAGEPFQSTLFNSYYSNYISEIFDPQKRLTKTKAFLPISMLLNFSLADKIRIFDVLYRINKIVTNFETMRSELELINAKETFGENISVTPIVPDKFKPVDLCITADDTTSLTQYATITVDNNCDKEGFDFLSSAELIPNDLSPGNVPKVNDFNEGVIVTKATIEEPLVVIRYTTEMYLAYVIAEAGKISQVPNVDEYGFFWSTNSSDLDDTEIETLRANSNVTDIGFKTNELNKRTLSGNINAKLDGLSSGQTIYWKFYVRTNTNALYPEADVLSPKQNTTTQ